MLKKKLGWVIIPVVTNRDPNNKNMLHVLKNNY